MRFFLIVTFLTLYISPIFSQYQMDLVTRQSPERSVSLKVGFTDITIHYSSPMVKNRIIWGELLPFDQVWRAGANWATTIEFSESVKIEGQLIPSGKYSLFVIPKEKEKWVVILNAVHRQWGAFKYDVNKDVIRIEFIPQVIPKQEKLIYEIDNYSSKLALVQLKWEKVGLQLPIEIDLVQPLDSLLSQKSTSLKNDTKWVAYLQAAELLLEGDQDLNQALAWIETSENLANLDMEWNKQYYPKSHILGHLYWTKARILEGLNRPKAALVAAEKMKNLADPIFYKRMAETEKIDEWISKWQK
ncbi:MAG: DUF2911 domain-containing protein [Bacteroidota bacterium]